MWVNSTGVGAVRTWVITPPAKWPMGLGLQSFLVGLRVVNPDTNFGITTKWQYSVDGCFWKDGTGNLIGQQTTASDFTGALLRSAAPGEFTPYVRVVIQVVNSIAAAVEVGAFISVWGYYQYNC